MNAIYLDNNATSPLLPCVWEAMQPYALARWGNPASSHRFGRRARQALEDARECIAALLDAHPDEVHFTSGATEANNLAILGHAHGAHGALGVIVTSLIEHPSVLEPFRYLEKAGHPLRLLPVTSEGYVHADDPLDGARFAAIQLANHETGAIQPVAELACRAPVHCDAAAAAGKMRVSFRALDVATLAIGAHKFHGPPGIGALVVRRGVKLSPLFHGGHQQHGTRPGTEPVALAVGMAAALAWSLEHLDANHATLVRLRQGILTRLRRDAEPVLLNGPEDGGLPGTFNLAFPGCNADALLMKLDLAGVACSTGSACSSGSLLPSPVLAAMGKTGPALHSALRFSFSTLLSEAELEESARRIADCVRSLRRADAG